MSERHCSKRCPTLGAFWTPFRSSERRRRRSNRRTCLDRPHPTVLLIVYIFVIVSHRRLYVSFLILCQLYADSTCLFLPLYSFDFYRCMLGVPLLSSSSSSSPPLYSASWKILTRASAHWIQTLATTIDSHRQRVVLRLNEDRAVSRLFSSLSLSRLSLARSLSFLSDMIE